MSPFPYIEKYKRHCEESAANQQQNPVEIYILLSRTQSEPRTVFKKDDCYNYFFCNFITVELQRKVTEKGLNVAFFRTRRSEHATPQSTSLNLRFLLPARSLHNPANQPTLRCERWTHTGAQRCSGLKRRHAGCPGPSWVHRSLGSSGKSS